MSGIATAVVAGAVISGIAASRSSKKAAAARAAAAKTGAAAQRESSQEAIAEQRRQFDITQEGLAPFREAGVGALQQQQALLGLLGEEQQQEAFAAFKESPGQKFLRERGQRSLLRGASAIGGLGGGNVRSALVQQGIGFAQQDFQNRFARLGQIAGQGQATALGMGQLGQATAGSISGLLSQQGLSAQQAALQAGQARSSGILGRNQAFQSALGGVFTGLGQSGLFDRPTTGGGM